MEAAGEVVMTRDELLAKIDTLEARYTDYPTYLALCAVVELHKPYGDIMCSVCEGISYPCSTIQAIEKELG